MDGRSLKTLEYNKILNILAGYCVNDGAKATALALRPENRLEHIEPALAKTDEAVGMSLRRGRPPISKNRDVLPYLKRARIQSTLAMEELLDIAAMLRVTKDLIGYYEEDADSEAAKPYLDDAFLALEACEDLEKDISKKILGPQEMADNASPELSRIRREMNLKNRQISEKLNALITSPAHEQHLQDKIITIRGGRYVVPVKAGCRAQVPGIVLDRSASGQTLFIEPVAVVELNNELRLLEAAEREEIERILKELTQFVAVEATVLEADYETLVELDFIFAKAAYALDIGGQRIRLTPSGPIALHRARHPLIAPQDVVASNIVLDEDVRTLVITGPNTGGKTVTLKTLGLLTLMIQSGLFIPVSENSSARVFTNVFADIGDEQSIEQSLSTFSSHMTNIVNILSSADDGALVLFDELGAGTDPEEGAALAVSILEELRKTAALTAATTHYSEIKEYALTTDGVINASVEFDVKTLRPTYRLLIGLPGKSNAFEIAARLGLPQDIIKASRKRLSHHEQKLDQTLAAAETQYQEARKLKDDAKRYMYEAKTQLKAAEQKERQAKDKAEKVLIKAQEKAQDLISVTKKETDTIYREVQKIQQSAAASVDNKTLEKLRREISGLEKTAQKACKKTVPKAVKSQFKLSDFKTGDRVYIKSLDREADVLSVLERDKKIEIMSGNMKMKLKPSELVIVRPEKKKTGQVRVQAATAKMDTRLDLRGRTADEARMMTEQFISDGVLLGKKKLEIIHGFGTGQVRKAVHTYLKQSPMVESFRLGGPGEGGAGVTVVSL